MTETKNDDVPDVPDIEKLVIMVNTLNVTMCRVYDALMAHLDVVSPEAAQFVSDVHESGHFLGAEPVVAPDPFSDPVRPPEKP